MNPKYHKPSLALKQHFGKLVTKLTVQCNQTKIRLFKLRITFCCEFCFSFETNFPNVLVFQLQFGRLK
jgi:hypothetical protein